MRASIFINYRRDDAAQAAGRIYDTLRRAFGEDAVFMDIDRIPYGSDFVDHIRVQLSSCKIVLVVIGKRWLSERRGIRHFWARRLDMQADWVRREIEIALDNKVTIVPLLVDDAAMPLASQLPTAIEPLASRNALSIRHDRFGADADALIASVADILGLTPNSARSLEHDQTVAIALVSCEVMDHDADAGLQSKVILTLKNNGRRTVVLQKGEFMVTGKVTMTDCMHTNHSMTTSSWTYDVDIEGDRSFKGKHHLQPNEVEKFEVLVGRERGGPNLTVYRANLRLKFDESDADLEVRDVFIRMTGPVEIRGAYIPGVSPEEFCRCMQDNLARFRTIGYDLRAELHPDTQRMLDKFERGEPLDEFKRGG